MTAIFAAAAVGMLITLLGTPLLIRFLHRRQYGQFIREDGPQGHFTTVSYTHLTLPTTPYV